MVKISKVCPLIPFQLSTYNLLLHLTSKHLFFLKNIHNIQIIGLGDSPNDLPLLLNSDIRIIIPGIDGPNLNLLDKLKDLEFILASEPNGYGWKNEINKLIKLEII